MTNSTRISCEEISQVHPIYSEYRELVHYWMLQILIPFGVYKKLLKDNECQDEDILYELGLSHLVEAEVFEANKVKLALKNLPLLKSKWVMHHSMEPIRHDRTFIL